MHRVTERLKKYGCVGYRVRKCIVCGDEYKPVTSKQKCCLSPECKNVLLRRLHNEWQKKYNHRNKRNPEYVLKKYIYGILRRCVKSKKMRSFKYLDFKIDEFKKHIELKFKDGMNWENYGKWHIDHIKPLCLFNFIDDRGNERVDEIAEANSLNNLQPLWARENLIKNARYEVLINEN